MSRARTEPVPAGTLRRYWPSALVRTVRAVPTITTLAPARGAPSFAASTVPLTVPVCWAVSALVASRAARQATKTGCEAIGPSPEQEPLRVEIRGVGPLRHRAH